MKTIWQGAGAAALIVALSGCSGSDNTGNTAATNSTVIVPSNKTLAAELGDADGLDTVSDLAKNAGLDDVPWRGSGHIPCFAPVDAAFQGRLATTSLRRSSRLR